MKHLNNINKLYNISRYRRLNFKHHVIPVVRKATENSSHIFSRYGAHSYYIYVLSENSKSLSRSAEKEVWTDSISINLHNPPLPLEATVPVEGYEKILVEKSSSLVISQSPSGEVVAVIYPPQSELSSAAKGYYVFKRWRNPQDITERSIKKLIAFMLRVNAYCGTVVFPNRMGIRALIKLQSKDEIIANGGSALWTWFTYTLKYVKALFKIHGFGRPS